MTTYFSLGYSGVAALKLAATEHGASEAELAAIDHLDEGTALAVDVERLEPLAKLAGLDWLNLYPEVFAKREMRRASGLASRFLELTVEGEETVPTAIVCTALALAMLAYADAGPVEGYTTGQSIENAFEMARRIKTNVEADVGWERPG